MLNNRIGCLICYFPNGSRKWSVWGLGSMICRLIPPLGWKFWQRRKTQMKALKHRLSLDNPWVLLAGWRSLSISISPPFLLLKPPFEVWTANNRDSRLLIIVGWNFNAGLWLLELEEERNAVGGQNPFPNSYFGSRCKLELGPVVGLLTTTLGSFEECCASLVL